MTQVGNAKMIVWRILLPAEAAIARKAHPKALDGLQDEYPGPKARLTGYRVARPLAATLGAGRKALAVVRAELSAPKSRSYNYAARKYPVAYEPAPGAPVAQESKRSRAMTGAQRIAAERKRQIKDEQFNPQHDSGHIYGELAIAACVYACPNTIPKVKARLVKVWPWNEWYKSKGRIRDLERAGALIAAEIDRLLALYGSGEIGD